MNHSLATRRVADGRDLGPLELAVCCSVLLTVCPRFDSCRGHQRLLAPHETDIRGDPALPRPFEQRTQAPDLGVVSLRLGRLYLPTQRREVVADPGSLPGSRLSAWLSNWVWVIPITMLAFLFLLFPTRRLLSRRWNPVAWGAVVSFSLVGILGIINATEMWRHPFTQSQAGGAVGFVLFFPFAPP